MFQTVCFDFDSTLTSIEGIDVLADFLQIEGVEDITNQAMNGEISTRAAFEKRIEAITPTRKQLGYLSEIYKSNLLPGVKELFKVLKFLEKKIIIVSGGFQEAIEPIGLELGADEVCALQLKFDEDGCGRLFDSVLSERDGKPRLLQSPGRLLGRSVFIGDGVTDYETRHLVDKMIPFFGVVERPFVRQSELEAYGGRNLLGLLGLILSNSEWNEFGLEFPRIAREAADAIIQPQVWFNLFRDLSFTRKRASRIFLIPGPTEIPDYIQDNKAPIMAHRSSEFEDLYSRTQALLRRFLGWERPFLTSNASATAMMEALLGSFSTKKILSCVSGSFGERFYQVATLMGHSVTRIDSMLGRGFTPSQVLDALDGHEIVLLTHNETSNGILNPVEEISTAIKASSENPLVFVDGVSSVGGIPLNCQAIDAILFGTQKCLALPPGLAFCAISQRMQELLKHCEPRSFYLDLKKTLKQHMNSNVPYTPAVDLFQSLELQLNKFLDKGKAHFDLYLERAQLVWDFCNKQGLQIFANEAFRSWSVSSVSLPAGVADLRERCAQKSVYLAGGYGSYKTTHFRIGHMGEITLQEMHTALKIIEENL
tara:strand:- start:240 stop:2027 length:1788 start_codon:yes stop_codon:yes gene_type:complete